MASGPEFYYNFLMTSKKKPEKKKSNAGRKPKKIDFDLAYDWAFHQMSDQKICKALGISSSSLYSGRGQYLELLETIKRARDEGLASLAKRAFRQAVESPAMTMYLCKVHLDWKENVPKESVETKAVEIKFVEAKNPKESKSK